MERFKKTAAFMLALIMFAAAFQLPVFASDGSPSRQVTEAGSTNTSPDGTVNVSKTIKETDMENVFDITLSVDTGTTVKEFYREPEIAVMIVLDVSNSMNDRFGGSTRVDAAIKSARDFIDDFAAQDSAVNRIGMVTFNTDAHLTVPMRTCPDAAAAAEVKSDIKKGVEKIVKKSDYRTSHSRFTNIEAGIKLAADELQKLTDIPDNKKYIIFLSDGFPTTYVRSGYAGWDPFSSGGTKGQDGVFYDGVKNKYCTGGTSYSDKGAIRARQAAAAARSLGITIYSIGIDIGAQTIEAFDFSGGPYVLDRTDRTYEIGSASDENAYKTWLKDSIGSGVYCDSTDPDELQAAYDAIFEDILIRAKGDADLQWLATDPMSHDSESKDYVEFIGFYDKSGTLKGSSLSGIHDENAENTAEIDSSTNTVSWDLKRSGYTKHNDGTNDIYTYSVTYRIRLKNELALIIPGTSYPTNNPTSLRYQYIESTEHDVIKSDEVQFFPVPEVKGYKGNLTFYKAGKKEGQTTEQAVALSGAGFTLHHDDGCMICQNAGVRAAIPDAKAVSASDGAVSFTGIPSGHEYVLSETDVPEGYKTDNTIDHYKVSVNYGVVTVTVVDWNGEETVWDGTDDVIYNIKEPVPELAIINITKGDDGSETGIGGFVEITDLSGQTYEVPYDTGYYEKATHVRFRPDVQNSYTYDAEFEVYWWEFGEDTSLEPPHKATVKGYMGEDGKPVCGNSGQGKSVTPTADVPVSDEKFSEVYQEILRRFSQFQVSEGSVVLDFGDWLLMPLKTVVKVKFLKPSEPPVSPDPGPGPEPKPIVHPVDPDPVKPEPVVPGPVKPGPVKPEPVVPGPVTPAPEIPDDPIPGENDPGYADVPETGVDNALLITLAMLASGYILCAVSRKKKKA